MLYFHPSSYIFLKVHCFKPSSDGLPVSQVVSMLMIQELNNLISPLASVYADVYFKLCYQGQACLSCLFVVLLPWLDFITHSLLKLLKATVNKLLLCFSVFFPFQLKWKCKKDNETNGGYSRDVLLKLLQKVHVLTNKIGGGLCSNHTLHYDTF